MVTQLPNRARHSLTLMNVSDLQKQYFYGNYYTFLSVAASHIFNLARSMIVGRNRFVFITKRLAHFCQEWLINIFTFLPICGSDETCKDKSVERINLILLFLLRLFKRETVIIIV